MTSWAEVDWGAVASRVATELHQLPNSVYEESWPDVRDLIRFWVPPAKKRKRATETDVQAFLQQVGQMERVK